MRRLAGGLAVSMAVAAGGWRARALTPGGAVAATLVGTAVVAGTSWPGIATLGAFFISSSALSKIQKTPVGEGKGSRRDAVQVLANGGVAGAASALLARSNHGQALAVVAGSLAAATADTWATEIGSSTGGTPRQIVSRRKVVPGESGGITLIGSLASVAGSALIAAVAASSGRARKGEDTLRSLAMPVFIAGVAGSLADSLAGELVQERRWCQTCERVTETRVHHCGTLTGHVSGVPGITNDVVNGICTATGAFVALLAYRK